jgi:CRP-like cAMP-binding protein
MGSTAAMLSYPVSHSGLTRELGSLYVRYRTDSLSSTLLVSRVPKYANFMLNQSVVLGALPFAVLDRLKPRLRVQDFPVSQVLFATGDRVESIYFPTAGAISLVTELAGGEMIESALLGRDGVVGGGAALDDRDAVYRAIVQVAGSGYALDVPTARQIAADSEEFRTTIVRHEQLILAQAQQSAACNAKHDLHERLARWLLRVRDVTGNDSFMLTQEFMAEMLGVRRTSVTLVAQSLQQAGFISYRRGNIRIEQASALEQNACECYVTIRNRYESLSKTSESGKAGAPSR